MTQKQKFIESLKECSRIIGFTGAGVSTESGIADYRSQGGIWQQFQPVYIDEFVNDEQKRLLYWQRKISMWQALQPATPGPAHRFFYELHKKGQLLGLITQNIDGLHEKSGLPTSTIVNLHGTSLEIICLSCADIQPAHQIMDNLDLDQGSPLCEKCGGFLKPNTISFGQSLRNQDLLLAEQLCKKCDLLIAAGSTLIVHPAASFPVFAKQHGAKLAIITLSDTPLDEHADFVFHEPLGPFLKNLF